MSLSISTKQPSSSHLRRLKELREKRLDNESELKIISKSKSAPSINWLDTPVGPKKKSDKGRVSSFSPIDEYEEDEKHISPKKSSYSPRLPKKRESHNGRIWELSPSTSEESFFTEEESSPVSGRKPTRPTNPKTSSGKEYLDIQKHRRTVSKHVSKKGGKRKTQRRGKGSKK
jgi:hypothetical protein